MFIKEFVFWYNLFFLKIEILKKMFDFQFIYINFEEKLIPNVQLSLVCVVQSH